MTQALTLIPIQEFSTPPPDDFKFDYAKIDAADADVLERHADSILEAAEAVKKATADGMLKIGKELTEAQQRLSRHGSGTFGRWCKERCGISRTSAHRFLKAYETFKDCSTVEQTMDASAVYVLSEKNCPGEATKEAIRQAGSGKHITGKDARKIIESCSAKTTRRKTCKNQGKRVDLAPIEEARRELEDVVKRCQKSVSAADLALMLRQLADSLDAEGADPAADDRGESDCNRKGKHAAAAVFEDEEDAVDTAITSTATPCKTTKKRSPPRPEPAARDGTQIVCVTYKGREYEGYVDGRCEFFRLKDGTASGWVSASGQLAAMIREAAQETATSEHSGVAEEHAQGATGQRRDQ